MSENKNCKLAENKTELLKCPCCGAKASVLFSRNASLGLSGWTADCSKCTDANYFIRFDRDRAVSDWNNYARELKTT